MGIYFLDIQYNYRYKMLKNIIHDSTYMFSVFGTKTHILYVQEVVTHSYIVTYHIKWVTTSWTDRRYNSGTYCTICPRNSDPFYIVTYCMSKK